MLPFNLGAGGSVGVDTGDIGHSLRFRGAQHLSRTFGTPTDNKRSTFSVWAKKAVNGAGATQYLFSANTAPTYTNVGIYSSTDTLGFYNSVSSTNSGNRTTTEVHRDVTGWNHYLVVFDTPNATAEDRMQLWKNGVRITAFSANTAIAQNANPQINAATFHHIGAFAGGEFWNGYLARICFVDGQALTPSSFGYFNTEINEWVSKSQSAVKAVVDAGGTNSFMLDFDDGTSLTTLGYDKSSKGNNWTLNNFSLTAGTSYDWMLDVPGNSFATLNPVYGSSGTFSSGNLQFVGPGAWACVPATIELPATGKWYACATMTGSAGGNTSGGEYSYFGLAPTGVSKTAIYNSGLGLWIGDTGFVYNFNATGTNSGSKLDSGNDVRLEVDRDANTYAFFKNGTQVATGTIGVAAGSALTFVYGSYSSANGQMAMNYGQRPVANNPSSGFKALCQRNMPDPAILNPEKHFDVLTWVGNNSTGSRTVSGANFTPDVVWGKDRTSAFAHQIYDVARGTGKSLASNSTAAEDSTNISGYVSSFNSDGFTATVGGTDNWYWNKLNDNYVAWLWKAGGAAVTNNAGSISSQVSANVTAGFSIVTYTGNLSSAGTATVGHGLGQAPGLVISKSRNNAGSASGRWVVRHKYLASVNHYLRLNTTDTPVNSSAAGSMSASTSTVFSTNWTSGMNTNGGNFVAYCFAEIPGFSKIFSYTGNGSADGPFVHCGFKPKFILYKRSDAAASWVIWDSLRSPDNVVNDYLLPNSSAAEAALDVLDILSNGFKLRTTNVDNNSGTIIGIAFADVPGKYALGR